VTTTRLMAPLLGLIIVLSVAVFSGARGPLRRDGDGRPHGRGAAFPQRRHAASPRVADQDDDPLHRVRGGAPGRDRPRHAGPHLRERAAEPPSKLGLRAGSTIRFRFLIRAAAIRSANDAATAIGEAISGSEAAFARRMNRTARALGMTRTTFRNAHGLTEDGHMSTARDMTLLGRRLVYDYPQYYNIFSRREDDAGIAQVRNTNRHVLNAYAGADGIKTGYTRAAGFNLVASAQRGQERIIATVFGGRSAAWRNQRIMELLDMGFARAPSNAHAPRARSAQATTMTGPPADGTRANGLVARSLAPIPRALAAPEPALVAAIGEAVQDAVGQALAEPAPRPSAVAPDAVARALTEALDPVDEERSPDLPEIAGGAPVPETRTQIALVEPPPLPGPAVPEVVTRASSTGSRLYGVSLGAQPSHHAAERLLLQTALAELGTFDEALRRVVQRSGGYEARFAGMTEEQAERACARLGARNMSCETFGP
jgi:D-alanyl-D-alanine carboxypeptidase